MALVVAALLAGAGQLAPRDDVARAAARAVGPAGAQTTARDRSDESPPNIVVVLLDDFPAMDGRLLERLPNLKETFVDQGILFMNYWANFSLCCPGRATLLTGQRAKHTGVTTNQATSFDPSVSLATQLQSIGYRTMIFGKYLNNSRNLSDKTPPGWDDVVIKDSGPYYEYPMWINGYREYHGSQATDYSTDVVANASMPFVRDAPIEQPLFIWLAPNATHGGTDEFGSRMEEPVPAPRHRGDERCANIPPWNPPSYNEADVSDKPAYVRALPLLSSTTGWPMQRACESLLSVDEWFGQVTAVLRTQGRYENTIFILSQDNGMGWGAHRIVGKIAPYTAEMSLYLSWPAVLGATAATNSTLLSNIDVAPTLCEFAGCVMGPFTNGFDVDGQSFAGLIDSSRSTSVPARDSVIIENGDGGAVPSFRALLTGRNHPRGRWLFVRYATGERELYAVGGGECWNWQPGDGGDPCMLTNVAAAKPKLRRALAAELTAEW